MSDEDDLGMMASGGIEGKGLFKELKLMASGDEEDKDLAKEKKLLEAFHGLHLDPNIESTEDLIKFMSGFGAIKTKVKKETAHDLGTDAPITAEPTFQKGGHQYAKLPCFYGDDKGEVSWATFKFEVDALINDKMFNKEQILLGIRRAVKGDAGDIVRRLGTGVSVKEVMKKLNTTFGDIETRETIFRKLYSCTQGPTESVTKFASRLEELFAQAVELGALKRTQEDILKDILFQGLRRELKQQAAYKYDTINDYDRFKIELRKLESEDKDVSASDKDVKKCKAAVDVGGKRGDSEMMEMRRLLDRLNEKIDKMEKDKEEDRKYSDGQQYGVRFRGGGTYRGNNQHSVDRGRGRGQFGQGSGRGHFGQGRGQFGQGSRGQFGQGSSRGQLGQGSGRGQYGQDTYGPTCYNCGLEGHIARRCPKV